MEKSKLLDRCGAEGEDRLLLAKVLDRRRSAIFPPVRTFSPHSSR